MSVQVLKFGGTSVGSAKSIKKIISILHYKKYNCRYVIVFSTFNGITDALIKCGKLSAKRNAKYHLYLEQIEMRFFKTIRNLFDVTHQSNLISKTKKSLNELEITCDSIFNLNEITKRSIDKIMSYGELITSLLIYEKFKIDGFNVVWKDSRDMIFTDEVFGCAKVFFFESSKIINKYFENVYSDYVILPGFIAQSYNKQTTTLGRGGSDYTASLISASINANILEIWTDVSGLLTSDPNLVNQTAPINIISYKESIELSYLGAKVLYFPTIFYNLVDYITISLKNTFLPLYPGSTITEHLTSISNITSISCITNFLIMTLEGTGIKKIRENIKSRNYNTNIMFPKMTFEYYINLLDYKLNKTIKKNIYRKSSIEKSMSIISVINNKITKKKGIIGKIFSALDENNINIRALALGMTENNLAVILSKKKILTAMNILHETFFQCNTKQINIFISGLGKVGTKLLEQLHSQKQYLYNKLKLQIRVIGISNSNMMYFNQYGLYDVINCMKYLTHGVSCNSSQFVKHMIKLRLRNSIWIDNTASNEITKYYNVIIGQGIGVITCNKMACSSSYKKYKKLKNLSRILKIPFYFETNVGAGLPILSTITDLINSGDKIYFIEAVLSGSLNFILNKIKNGFTLLNSIKKAQSNGYTEPDPRLDLSGIDVMRKIMILVRECGEHLELKNINHKSFLPESCLKASSIEDFYKSINNCEKSFKYLKNRGESFLFIAKYKSTKKKKVSVGLKNLGRNHPFTNLEGTDNMIIYTTKRYFKSPLIIQGAGAGAEVTASGVFADIIKASL